MCADQRLGTKGIGRPLVSVVMAVKNAETTVQDSVASIRCQTLPDWELLIVDDESSDATVEIVGRLVAEEPRVRLLSSPGLGPGGARNLAIAGARGRYVAILDADDIATEARLERQTAALEADPTLAAVASAAYHFVRPGIPVGVRPADPTTRRELRAMIRDGALVVWSNSTMCWRTRFLNELGGFDPAFPQAEDAELMNRAVYKHAMTILGLPDKLVWYRLSRESLSSAGLAQQRMIARYLEFRNQCWLQHAPVPSLADFLSHRPSPREKVRWARHDLAARLYREAGYRVAAGGRKGILSRLLVSVALHPRYVIPKLWRQRVRATRMKH